jgi:hypothetical protein
MDVTVTKHHSRWELISNFVRPLFSCEVMRGGLLSFLAWCSIVVLCGQVLAINGNGDYEKLKAALRKKHLAIVNAQKPKQSTGTQAPSQLNSGSDASTRFQPDLSGPVVNPHRSNHSGGAIAPSAYMFYNLTVLLGRNNSYHSIPRVHLIRIPKASSSSLSAIARRAVGCGPPGPCCRYPGEPAGSCPLREMFVCQEQKKVIGCTDHFPNLWFLFKSDVPTISMMRNPFSRSISGFFYPGIHHNSECGDNVASCFVQYTRDPKWRNIAVKMLTGDYAYSPRQTCVGNSTCNHSLQLAIDNLQYFAFMGVAEMWELSMAVLHRKLPHLRPELSEFRMGMEENSITKGERPQTQIFSVSRSHLY